MAVGVLERLHQPYRLVHTTADRQIVHCDLPQNALLIDDEQAAQRMAQILQIDAIVLGDGVRQVAEQRNIDFAQAALFRKRKTNGLISAGLMCRLVDAAFSGLCLSQGLFERSRQKKPGASDETCLFSRRVDPCQVREMRVNAAGNHLGVHVPELMNAIGKCQNLRRAYKGAVANERVNGHSLERNT